MSSAEVFTSANCSLHIHLKMTSGVVNGAALIDVVETCFPDDVYVPNLYEDSSPLFPNLQAFLNSLTPEQRNRAEKQTQNLIKRCSHCGKANAKSLENCNNCGSALPTKLTIR